MEERRIVRRNEHEEGKNNTWMDSDDKFCRSHAKSVRRC